MDRPKNVARVLNERAAMLDVAARELALRVKHAGDIAALFEYFEADEGAEKRAQLERQMLTDLANEVAGLALHNAEDANALWADYRKDENPPDRFTVMLNAAGENKVDVIRAVREVTGLGLGESKGLVDNAPHVVKTGLSKAEATRTLKKLNEAGATAEMR